MVPVHDLYEAWVEWAEGNGHVKKTKQVFGRDLRAALPNVKVEQPGSGNNRERWYTGIRLRDPDPGPAHATHAFAGNSASTQEEFFNP